MTRWIGMTSLGQLTRDVVTDIDPVQDGIFFIEVDALAQIDVVRQYWDGGSFVDKGLCPYAFGIFNYYSKQWEPDQSSAWESVKKKRALLLSESDWVVTKAAESGQTAPPKWVAYRQALRDITLQADPWAIVWPVAP